MNSGVCPGPGHGEDQGRGRQGLKCSGASPRAQALRPRRPLTPGGLGLPAPRPSRLASPSPDTLRLLSPPAAVPAPTCPVPGPTAQMECSPLGALPGLSPRSSLRPVRPPTPLTFIVLSFASLHRRRPGRTSGQTRRKGKQKLFTRTARGRRRGRNRRSHATLPGAPTPDPVPATPGPARETQAPNSATPARPATWGSTLVADMLHEQPARGGSARRLGLPRGRACHPHSRGPGPAAPFPGAGREAAAAADGRAGRSRDTTQRGKPGRNTRTRGRFQWRRRWQRRRRRGRGCATSARAGQAGTPTSRHAPRLRTAARREGSRAWVLASRCKAGPGAGRPRKALRLRRVVLFPEARAGARPGPDDTRAYPRDVKKRSQRVRPPT